MRVSRSLRCVEPAVLATVAGVLASGCASTGPAAPGNRFSAGTQDFMLPVASQWERRFATVIRQQFDFSCGSAALATLLSYHYATPTSEATVFNAMWREGDREKIRRLGFSLLDMKRYLESQGMAADGFQVSIAQIAQARTPGIALISLNGYKHFIVIKGVVGDQVLVGNPASGLVSMPVETFRQVWNGVFFVITRAPHAAVFNASADWALLPRAPLDKVALPLSVAALALQRPIINEF